MDMDDLRTFVAVADAGGVSAAARRLGLSKSIVSRRLFRIEAELGVQLLARTTRGAALTEAGVPSGIMRPGPVRRSTRPGRQSCRPAICAAICGSPCRFPSVRRISPRCLPRWRTGIPGCISTAPIATVLSI
ncbi:helix-turn-helix domain-containing protein [Oceanibaculum indicum]|uniref:helix-turn-helix domain-containing protein n=1 Tax=Oceanibaculum indicum TaxID=526216 RepID=UPI002AC362A0|nr:LysR family transcriptional regulator [Oceanibaculum indicum]